MTAQIGEALHYNGRTTAMCTEPLSDYFSLGGVRPDFARNCTALWRGYVGKWELRDDRLYLVGLSGTLNNGVEANLATIFSDYPNRVFAHWYSGTLRIPEGKRLDYVHMGYGSRYEKDLLVHIEKGVMTGTNVRCNGKAGDREGPEGYGVGAMTTFPLEKKEEEVE